MATQVKVTVWPREAWMVSWGGVTTWGGTGEMGAGMRGLRGEAGRKGPKGTGPSAPSSLLTAAKLVAAVRTVALLVAVEAGRDAGVAGDTPELRGCANLLRVLGGW